MPNIVPFTPALLNQAPYTIWRDVGLTGRLSHDVVAARFARWLTQQYAQTWWLQTDRKIRWYLQRRDGLRAWCLEEAKNRLGAHYQDTWSVLAFHEFHFSEAVMENNA